MRRFRNRNHALDVAYERSRHRFLLTGLKLGGVPDAISFDHLLLGRQDGSTPDKRALIYSAVRGQLEGDNKRPWRLGQKLNDSPYRYTRDTLWAALNEIGGRLEGSVPPIRFGTEGGFSHPTVPTFAKFVNRQLPGTVSELINGILEASRWAR